MGVYGLNVYFALLGGCTSRCGAIFTLGVELESEFVRFGPTFAPRGFSGVLGSVRFPWVR